MTNECNYHDSECIMIANTMVMCSFQLLSWQLVKNDNKYRDSK